MEAYRAEATNNLGGKLHLDHLSFKTGERVEVVVRSATTGTIGWLEGYFAATFGAFSDDSFFRHPQSELNAQHPGTESTHLYSGPRDANHAAWQ